MARSPRDRRAEYRARNLRAKRLGFRSYGEQRHLGGRLAGRVRNRDELDRLPAAAQDRRDEATEVLSYARRHGLGLSDAVRQLGMPGADRTVQFFFPDAVQRTRAGLVPTERDEAFRPMAALTPRGWVEVETRDSATASILGAHAATVRGVVEGRLPASALRPFEGLEVEGHRLLTDPRRLRALAREGRLEGAPYPRRGR